MCDRYMKKNRICVDVRVCARGHIHANQNMMVMWVQLRLSGYSGALMNVVM